MIVRDLINKLIECENLDAPIFLYDQNSSSLIDIVMVDDGFEGHDRVDINF
jgi:hypothetical protein